MTKKRKRLNPDVRKENILDAAATVATANGYKHITRDLVAKEAGVSAGLVTTYFNTMPQLRRDLIRYAIRNNLQKIIAQAVVNNDPQTAKLTTEQKQKALESLAE